MINIMAEFTLFAGFVKISIINNAKSVYYTINIFEKLF